MNNEKTKTTDFSPPQKLPQQLQSEVASQLVSNHLFSSPAESSEIFSPEKRYIALKMLGEGGMSVVQLVQDSLLCREVALKMIKKDPLQESFQSKAEKRNWRLKREAKITAILEHPNIIPLYDMQKKDEEELYFTMRKVEGETFASILKKKSLGESTLDQEDLLLIFHKICDAVSYAHAKGVIHRDLKPANIMLGQFGEVYVMDWGIAKYLSPYEDKIVSQEVVSLSQQQLFDETKEFNLVFNKEDSFRTIGGIGTQGYMPPEQAENANTVREQADIYALGKILKQCFVYRSPLEELKERIDQRIQIQQGPRRKELWQSSKHKEQQGEIPEDIRAIIQKATEKDWQNRYASVKDLSADVERYRKNLRVSVRQYKLNQIFKKWVQRNKFKLGILVSFLGVCFSLLLGFFGYLVYDRQQKFEQNLRLAKEEKETKTESHEQKLQQLMKALNYINSALSLKPKDSQAESFKLHLSEELVNLACTLENYQFASYIIADISHIGNKEHQHLLETQLKIAKTKILKKHQERLQYWKKSLKDPHPRMRDEALLEINKMDEPEIFEELVQVVQEGTEYFLNATERTPKQDEYYVIMATLLGALENPKAGEIIWSSLEKLAQSMLRFEESVRPYADLDYMIALSEALMNSKAQHYSKNFVKLVDMLGKESTFGQKIYGISQTLIERDQLASKMNPRSADEYYERANIKAKIGELYDAIDDYTQAIRLNPQHFLAYQKRGNIKREFNHIDDALKDYEKAIRIQPQNEDLYIDLAFAKIYSGDLEEAIENYTHALTINPKKYMAYIFRGEIKKRTEDIEGALADYTEAIRLNPSHSEIYISRGLLKNMIHDFEGAIEDYNIAARLNPNDFYIYSNRGNSKNSKNDFEGAIQDYNKAIYLNPKYAGGYTNRGSVKLRKGDLEGALADLNEALRLNPQFSDVYVNRAVIKRNQKDFKGAIEDLDKALSVMPYSFAIYNNRGNVKKDQGDFKGALDDYTQAIQISPQSPESYYSRGVLRWELNDFDGALKDYNIVILLSPPSAMHYNNRGLLKSINKDIDGALQDFYESIRLDPQFAFPYFNLGNTYQQQKNFDEALHYWEKGLTLHNDPHILRKFVDTLLNQTKQQLAQKNYTEGRDSLLRLKQNLPPNDPRLKRIDQEIQKIDEILSTEKK